MCVCVHVCACWSLVTDTIYVTQSERTDHVLHTTKNEIMIVFISTSFLLAHRSRLAQ